MDTRSNRRACRVSDADIAGSFVAQNTVFWVELETDAGAKYFSKVKQRQPIFMVTFLDCQAHCQLLYGKVKENVVQWARPSGNVVVIQSSMCRRGADVAEAAAKLKQGATIKGGLEAIANDFEGRLDCFSSTEFFV